MENSYFDKIRQSKNVQFCRGEIMDLFETIMINVIFIIFPLVFCLLYQSYNQTLNKEKSDLFLDFALISSFYLILRFGLKMSIQPPILLFNIPLVLAYLKNRKVNIVLLSICIIFYYSFYFKISLSFLIIEYVIYYVIYQLWNKKKWNISIFINLLLLGKCLGIAIAVLCLSTSMNFHILDYLIINFSFVVITKFTIYLFERAEEVLSLHLKLKEFEKEKKLRESLFKITHEIKNPIAVCKGYLDMFDVNNIEHSRKYVPILKDEIARILILLEDFLSINKIKIEKEIMDVNLLLESIYQNFVPILEDRNIEATFDVREDELFMIGDYNRLSQVLINIIKNSIEAIPNQKKGYLNVSLEESSNNLKIIIEDNGKGMTKDELSKIKEPFFTTKEKGTGLGIYLSNEIIKEHGGTIEYLSEVEKGTTVILTFPRKQAEFESL